MLKKGVANAPEKRIKRQKEYVRDAQLQFVRAIQNSFVLIVIENIENHVVYSN